MANLDRIWLKTRGTFGPDGVVTDSVARNSTIGDSASEACVFKNQLVTFAVVSSIEDMALEIKTTPILTGESANRFIEIIEKNQDKRVSASKKESMKKLALQVLSKAKI